jgi:F1F0 ATPase subunit 2
MAMSDTLTWLLAGLAGAVLGAFFFGGLWWTVRKGASSGRPALWFLGSGLLRMSITLSGFYLVGGGQGRRLLGALIGFVIARLLVMWLTRPAGKPPSRPTQEVSHAP